MIFKNKKIVFEKDHIRAKGDTIIMHKWESPIMQHMAGFICQNGGDIIEMGFGMGISANFIQEHAINSHTICEIHPEIIPLAEEWAQDKDNVRIITGCWWEQRELLETYDGIFFDTHLDAKASKLRHLIPKICNDQARVTWWNNVPRKWNEHKLPGVEFEVLHVNPPENDYFNHKEYHMPKYIHHG